MRSVVLASPARSWVWSALGALMLVFGVATTSRAEPTNTITEGTLQTLINALDPIYDTLTAPVAATVTRDGSDVLQAVGFPGERVLDQRLPRAGDRSRGAYPIAGIQATVANQTANFARSGGKIGGTMPLSGVNKVCLFQSCSIAIANLSVPISVVGLGGSAFATGAVNLTVKGAPWTQGTASIGTVTKMGNAAATTQMATTMGGISNTISLVTPIFVSTNIGASAVVPVWGFLDFKLVSSAPEPGTIAALGAAIVSLVSVGFVRRRR